MGLPGFDLKTFSHYTTRGQACLAGDSEGIRVRTGRLRKEDGGRCVGGLLIVSVS